MNAAGSVDPRPDLGFPFTSGSPAFVCIRGAHRWGCSGASVEVCGSVMPPVITVDRMNRLEGNEGTGPPGKQGWDKTTWAPWPSRVRTLFELWPNLMLQEALESHHSNSLTNAPTAPVVRSLMRKL